MVGDIQCLTASGNQISGKNPGFLIQLKAGQWGGGLDIAMAEDNLKNPRKDPTITGLPPCPKFHY